MENAQRTLKESAEIVAKTIHEIRKVIEKPPKNFGRNALKKLIANTCKKNKINQLHIIEVGGWSKYYKSKEYAELRNIKFGG